MMPNTLPDEIGSRSDGSGRVEFPPANPWQALLLTGGCFLSDADYTKGDFVAVMAICQADKPAFSRSKGVIA
jgi:hypothetical protein